MLSRRLLILTALALPLLAAAGTIPETDQQSARAVAEELLALIDDGKFDEAWEHAAPSARERATGSRFVEEMRRAQGQLGERVSRKWSEAQFETELPDLPDGQYALFQLDSEFSTAGEVQEGISLQRLDGGEWMLLGYFVHPRR